MKFDCLEEELAFKFICDMASNTMSNNGCNDLDKECKERFKNCKVIRNEGEGMFVADTIKYDFDILEWLMNRAVYKEVKQ